MGIFQNRKTNDEDALIKEIIKNDTQEGILILDKQGEILFCNKLVDDFLEQKLFCPEDILAKKMLQVTYRESVYETVYKDGMKEIPGGAFTVLFQNVSEHILRMKELAQLQEKVEEISNFKSAFLANMSHEIRTPIHAIIGFVELMMRENPGLEMMEKLSLIKSSSYSLLAIINDVLDISKIESGKMELVNTTYYISYLFRDIEATFSLMAAKKGLSFSMLLDDNIPACLYGDKVRIRGVLFQILNNAVKFTRTGEIQFHVHVLEKSDEKVKLAFEVRDTGSGIRQEDLAKLFESFRRFDIRNDYSIEGIGVGLSIANGYVKLMGGEIKVESAYGKGSEFTVILEQKVMDDAVLDTRILQAHKELPSKKFQIAKCQVLVVDDNPVNLQVADGLMKSYGLTVDKASGGREAVEACRQKKYDMIFMDEMMPEVDGIAAMRQIRAISEYYAKKTRIIVLTADAMSGARDRLMADGFDEYLCKPLEMHRLEEMFRRFVPEQNFMECSQPFSGLSAGTSDEESEITEIAKKLEMDKELLKRKIADCGGSVAEYLEICRIAYKHGFLKIKKLRELQQKGDYEGYTIEVHALKSSAASLGAMEISQSAGEQEIAGKEGNYRKIDDHIDMLLISYKSFLDKLGKLLDMQDIELGEEWSPEEIRQVCRNIEKKIESFDFGAIFDILEKLESIPMGAETGRFFREIDQSMNEMDIEKVKQLVKDTNGTKHTIAQER